MVQDQLNKYGGKKNKKTALNLTPYTNINSEQIIGLNVKSKLLIL